MPDHARIGDAHQKTTDERRPNQNNWHAHQIFVVNSTKIIKLELDTSLTIFSYRCRTHNRVNKSKERLKQNRMGGHNFH